jgi:deoxyhypusine synthase
LKKAVKKKKIRPLSTKGIKTYSLKTRKSKVDIDDIAKLPVKGGSFEVFLKSLPNVLAANDLRAVIAEIVRAHKNRKTVVLGMGAHVIKVGLAPLVIDLMRRGVISAVAMNGAGIVHDFELAYMGSTSEDVDKELCKGNFGMAEETGRLINGAIKKGAKAKKGLGESVGEMIEGSRYPYKDLSILAAGVRYGVPVTVHVAIGTDIVHIHPSVDGAATGQTSLHDFKVLSSVVSTLEQGVFINLGSAVIIPEILLKALTLVRNLGHKVSKITTVNMDFIQSYRPLTNVVRRPTMNGGKGYTLTGHHEIMFPLLYAGIIQGLPE